MTRQQEIEVEAVLTAAAEWVTAQEALLAAQQRSGEATTELEAVDVAGSRLVVAVAAWLARCLHQQQSPYRIDGQGT
jgi:hypothetical protein